MLRGIFTILISDLVARWRGAVLAYEYRRELYRVLAMNPGPRFLYMQQRGFKLVKTEEGREYYEARGGKFKVSFEVRS